MSVHRSEKEGSDTVVLDVGEIITWLWSGRKTLFLGTFSFALLSIMLAILLPNKYTASALLAPSQQSGSALSGLMSQYGGIANLAGLSLPGGEEKVQTAMAIELMHSRAFIGDFVDRHSILPEIMAAKSWNLKTGKLEFDSDDYLADTGEWIRDVKPPYQPRPSVLEVHEKFLEIMTIVEDPKTGFVTVSIEHLSPTFAAQLVTLIVQDINDTLRQKDIKEASDSIEFLKQQISNTSLADLQAVFFELIQSQTETMMLAEVRPEYVFSTMDAAVAPEEKSSPKRALICGAGTILGFLISCFVIVARRVFDSYQDH